MTHFPSSCLPHFTIFQCLDGDSPRGALSADYFLTILVSQVFSVLKLLLGAVQEIWVTFEYTQYMYSNCAPVTWSMFFHSLFHYVNVFPIYFQLFCDPNLLHDKIALNKVTKIS